MEPSSSARPAELARYGRAGAEAGARLEAETRYLEAALTPFRARCTEYRVVDLDSLVARLAGYSRREAELAAWAAEVARGFQIADTGAAAGPDGPQLPAPQWHSDGSALATVLWNLQAHELILLLRQIRRDYTRHGIGGMMHRSEELFALTGAGVAAGGALVGLVAGSSLPHMAARPPLSPTEGLWQLLHSFWIESMAHLDPELFRSVSAELDALKLTIATARGALAAEPRADDQAETVVDARTGALDVTAAQAFPLTGGCALAGVPFRPLAAEAFAGDHSGISYFPDEQVRLERLNGATGDYRLSIAGLDPSKPAAPNNLEAVALTAQGEREDNHYYQLVKQRFLAALATLPAGSTLHLEGHSMGGGMCLLLRDDPEVALALTAAGVVIGSLITFGAVRPRGSAGAARDDAEGPFAGAEERHYVNGDDSLARNVGAGHEGYPGVIMLENGRLDEPSGAHTDYDNPDNYVGLPVELQTLPFVVDPATYVVYSLAPPTTQASSPTPTPTPAEPAPTPTPAARSSHGAP